VDSGHGSQPAFQDVRIGLAGARGVAARALSATGTVTVLCTATNGSIYRWEDDGAVADGGMPTSTVITAPSGTAFRGLGF
jgi:hypothetical protein